MPEHVKSLTPLAGTTYGIKQNIAPHPHSKKKHSKDKEQSTFKRQGAKDKAQNTFKRQGAKHIQKTRRKERRECAQKQRKKQRKKEEIVPA